MIFIIYYANISWTTMEKPGATDNSEFLKKYFNKNFQKLGIKVPMGVVLTPISRREIHPKFLSICQIHCGVLHHLSPGSEHESF